MKLQKRDDLIGIPKAFWKAPEFTLSDAAKIDFENEKLTVTYYFRKNVKNLYRLNLGQKILSIDYSCLIFPCFVFSLTFVGGRSIVVFLCLETTKTRHLDGKVFWPLTNGKFLINSVAGNDTVVFSAKGDDIPNYPKMSEIIEEKDIIFIPYFVLAVLGDIPREFPKHLILNPMNMPKFFDGSEGPYPQGSVTLRFKDGTKTESLENVLKWSSDIINPQLDRDPNNVLLYLFGLETLETKIGIIKIADHICSKKLPWLIMEYYICGIFHLSSYDTDFFPLS